MGRRVFGTGAAPRQTGAAPRPRPAPSPAQVFKAHLGNITRRGNIVTTDPIFETKRNLANCAVCLDRTEELVALRRELCDDAAAAWGLSNQNAVDCCLEFAGALLKDDDADTALKLLRVRLAHVKAEVGANDLRTIMLSCGVAQVLCDPNDRDREYPRGRADIARMPRPSFERRPPHGIVAAASPRLVSAE